MHRRAGALKHFVQKADGLRRAVLHQLGLGQQVGAARIPLPRQRRTQALFGVGRFVVAQHLLRRLPLVRQAQPLVGSFQAPPLAVERRGQMVPCRGRRGRLTGPRTVCRSAARSGGPAGRAGWPWGASRSIVPAAREPPSTCRRGSAAGPARSARRRLLRRLLERLGAASAFSSRRRLRPMKYQHSSGCSWPSCDGALVLFVRLGRLAEPLQGEGPFVRPTGLPRLKVGGDSVTDFPLGEVAVGQVDLAQLRQSSAERHSSICARTCSATTGSTYDRSAAGGVSRPRWRTNSPAPTASSPSTTASSSHCQRVMAHLARSATRSAGPADRTAPAGAARRRRRRRGRRR